VPARGVDVIQWFVNSLKQFEEVRSDVPHLASVADQASYLDALWQKMADAWRKISLTDFLCDREAKIVGRPTLALPVVNLLSADKLSRETKLMLVRPRQLRMERLDDGSISFAANGIKWPCSARFEEAIQKLNSGRAQSIAQLSEGLSDAAEQDKLVELITSLVAEGCLIAEPQRASTSGS
jgi:hypothetical protein